MKNNICIGYNAGKDLPMDAENVLIIGDDITNLNIPQPNVLFIGNKIAIGSKVLGVECNLKEILENYISLELKDMDNSEIVYNVIQTVK